MMKKGKKMLSFVKYEKELESSYRERLSSVKKPEEIGDVFIDCILSLLKKIHPEVNSNHVEEIVFDPDSSEGYTLSQSLQKILGDELLKNSDLLAIIKRFAQSALHRYHSLASDEERTELFRLTSDKRD